MQYTKLFEILILLWWDTIIAFMLLIFEGNAEMYIEVKNKIYLTIQQILLLSEITGNNTCYITLI